MTGGRKTGGEYILIHRYYCCRRLELFRDVFFFPIVLVAAVRVERERCALCIDLLRLSRLLELCRLLRSMTVWGKCLWFAMLSCCRVCDVLRGPL